LGTACVPGNLLAEGRYSLEQEQLRSTVVHVHAPEVVSFHVFDRLEGDSARDYTGHMRSHETTFEVTHNSAQMDLELFYRHNGEFNTINTSQE
jgi:hypothetical protein